MKTILLLISLMLIGCASGSGGDVPVVTSVPDNGEPQVTTLYKLTCRSGEVQVERYPGVYSGWNYELEMYSDGSYRVKCGGATAPGYADTNETYVDANHPKFPDKSCIYTSAYRNSGGFLNVRKWDIEPPTNVVSGNRGSIKANCTAAEANNSYCDYEEPTAPIIAIETEPLVYDVYGTCHLTN